MISVIICSVHVEVCGSKQRNNLVSWPVRQLDFNGTSCQIERGPAPSDIRPPIFSAETLILITQDRHSLQVKQQRMPS